MQILWSEATSKPQCRAGTRVPVRAGGVKLEAQENKMKILRLSIFNIKKRKKEAFVITLLLAISMALMGVGIINIEKADRIFSEAFEIPAAIISCI